MPDTRYIWLWLTANPSVEWVAVNAVGDIIMFKKKPVDKRLTNKH